MGLQKIKISVLFLIIEKTKKKFWISVKNIYIIYITPIFDKIYFVVIQKHLIAHTSNLQQSFMLVLDIVTF